MYAPPPPGYARTVCLYEPTTIAMSAAIAMAIGMTYCIGAVVATVSARRISPVAYETDDSASDAKTGSASTFGRSVCSRLWLENARPSSTRLATEPGEGFGWGLIPSPCYRPD